MEHAKTRAFSRRTLLFAASALAGAAAFAAPLSPHGARADDATAEVVAARVQAFYEQTDTLAAQFHQTYYNRLYRKYTRSGGTLTVDKPGRFRFEYADPNGKLVVSDGSQVTAFEPTDTDGHGQYVQQPASASTLPGALAFLTGTADLEHDYRFRLLSASTYHFAGHVLELRPKKADPGIARILLFVDADPARAGVVHTIRIDDHDGNRNKFELRSLRFNRRFDPRLFAYEPPPGARRIRTM